MTQKTQETVKSRCEGDSRLKAARREVGFSELKRQEETHVFSFNEGDINFASLAS